MSATAIKYFQHCLGRLCHFWRKGDNSITTLYFYILLFIFFVIFILLQDFHWLYSLSYTNVSNSHSSVWKNFTTRMILQFIVWIVLHIFLGIFSIVQVMVVLEVFFKRQLDFWGFFIWKHFTSNPRCFFSSSHDMNGKIHNTIVTGGIGCHWDRKKEAVSWWKIVLFHDLLCIKIIYYFCPLYFSF